MNLTTSNAAPKALLGIYLNDHLTGATAGIELAKRCRGSNEGTPLGDYLGRFISEIEEDRDAVRALLQRLGLGENRLKQLGGFVAEKLGRLKLNGQLTGYSPLSRLLEVEGLCLGVEGRISLLRSLQRIAHHPQVATMDLDAMLDRAERQRAELEQFRQEAAVAAFGGSTDATGPGTRSSPGGTGESAGGA